MPVALACIGLDRWTPRMKHSIRRAVFFGSGLALVLLSIPFYLSPLPLGLVMSLAGIYLMSRASPRVRWAARRLRRRLARATSQSK